MPSLLHLLLLLLLLWINFVSELVSLLGEGAVELGALVSPGLLLSALCTLQL